ncbi:MULTISPECIES: hypothetical protein [unclassified Salinibacterium]|uniref:hypothetical protein n=1 Tax=unclassified Salinibacterium TaxID=2632331 RepID=UPI00141D931A|nr:MULTISPECIES: hypothetical protein [unclassified Salinibacterium]
MGLYEVIMEVIIFFGALFIVATLILLVYLMPLLWVIADLMRDPSLSGWYQALWIFFLLLVPLLPVLAYLITRGSGMDDRKLAEHNERRARQMADPSLSN